MRPLAEFLELSLDVCHILARRRWARRRRERGADDAGDLEEPPALETKPINLILHQHAKSVRNKSAPGGFEIKGPSTVAFEQAATVLKMLEEMNDEQRIT